MFPRAGNGKDVRDGTNLKEKALAYFTSLKTINFSSIRKTTAFRYVCMLSIVAILLSSYYSFLTSLYLVDEVLEGAGPRELTLEEKFTLIVHAPQDNVKLLGLDTNI